MDNTEENEPDNIDEMDIGDADDEMYGDEINGVDVWRRDTWCRCMVTRYMV